MHRLYFVDSAARTIHCYDYSPDTGEANNCRALVRLPETEGLPDGLAVDAEGFLRRVKLRKFCEVRSVQRSGRAMQWRVRRDYIRDVLRRCIRCGGSRFGGIIYAA
jgi:hypothetical protein